MQNIGIWHYFNPNDRGSYPVVRTRIQVKYANGVEDEGEWVEFFSQVKSLVESPITGWALREDMKVYLRQPYDRTHAMER